MKNTLKIKLTFTDRSPDGEDVTETVADAEYIIGEECVISYREGEELGMGDTQVSICWSAREPQRVRIVRRGEVESEMRFAPGECASTPYNVGGMRFELCTRTTKCQNSFDGSLSGKLAIDYTVELGGDVVGDKRMRVCVLP